MIWIRRYVFYITVVFIVAVLFFIQFSQPLIIGADGNYHAQIAHMIGLRGFLSTLPQAHFSWFITKFSDKDFVYHLVLVPFVFVFGLISGAKIVAFFGSLALCLSVIYIVRSYGPSWYTIVAGLLLVTSSQFLRDIAEPRPFVWAIICTLLGLYVISKKKKYHIFAISFVYGMLHLSAWLLPLFAIIYALIDWSIDGVFNWKLIIAACAGYLLSFFIHPNFPNNIFIFYLNGMLVPWYVIKGGLELGAEFFPLTTRDVFTRYPLIFGSGIVLLLLIRIKNIELHRETQFWGVAASVFLFLGIFSTRNLTHFYPVFIIFMTLLIGNVYSVFRTSSQQYQQRILSIFIPICILVIIAGGVITYSNLNVMLTSDQIYSAHFLRMANVFEAKIPSGSRIYHSNWSDSQYFIGYAPNFEYFVTMDPIYMFAYNQTLYNEYRQLSFGSTSDPYTVLTHDFDTYYGYIGKNYFGGLISQVRQDKRFEILDEDALGMVFAIHKNTNSK